MAGGVLSRQERPVSGRLLVRTVAVPDPGTCSSASPAGRGRLGASRAGLAGWGEAVRVTLPAGDDRFTAGRSGFARCSRRRSRRPGPGARLGPGRVRYLHLRCLVGRLGPDRPAHGARPGWPWPGLAHHSYRTGRGSCDLAAARESRAGRADGPELARRQPARATLGAGGGRGGRRDQGGARARWCSPAMYSPPPTSPSTRGCGCGGLASAIRTASRSPATG